MSTPEHLPYTILSQDFTEELMPNGTFADTWRVTYQGQSGTVAYVRVPASQYSPHMVDAMIQAELVKIETVHALGSAPPADLGIPPM